MIDGKKVIKLLKTVRSIAAKLQPNTETVTIRGKGIYLIDERQTTAFIESPLFSQLFPIGYTINLVDFAEFMKGKKMKDFLNYEYSEDGAVLTFKSELYDVDGSLEQFPFYPIESNGKYNWKKKTCIDNFMKRVPSLVHLEEENEELKEILNNSHFPYLYKGFMVMKSICPILTAKAKLFSYDLREEEGIVEEGLSAMAFRVNIEGLDVYSLYQGLVIRELKFASKKRW